MRRAATGSPVQAAGAGGGEPGSGARVAAAQGLQPALGVFPQDFEGRFRRERTAHGKPSFPCQTSAYERPEEGFVRSISDWMGASSLAADRRRSRGALGSGLDLEAA